MIANGLDYAQLFLPALRHKTDPHNSGKFFIRTFNFRLTRYPYLHRPLSQRRRQIGDSHGIQGKNVVSVKGGCIDGLDWGTATHIWTRSAMVPIPEGSEAHSEEPPESDYSGSQETLDQPSDHPGPLMNSGGFPEETQLPEAAKLGRIRGACELSG